MVAHRRSVLIWFTRGLDLYPFASRNYHSTRHLVAGSFIQSTLGQIAVDPGTRRETLARTQRNRDACHERQFQTRVGLRSSTYPTSLFEARCTPTLIRRGGALGLQTIDLHGL